MFYLVTYNINLKSRETDFLNALKDNYEFLPLMPNSAIIICDKNATEILKNVDAHIKLGIDHIFIIPFDVDGCDGYIPKSKIDWILSKNH